MVKNFDDLITKIDEDINRQEYKIYQTQLGVNVIYLTKNCPPSILATIAVKKNLKLPFFVVNRSFLHLLTPTFCHQTKSLLLQISNIMAFAKSFLCNKPILQETLSSKLVALVGDFLEKSENDRKICFLKFLSEQLELMLQSKHCRNKKTNIAKTKKKNNAKQTNISKH